MKGLRTNRCPSFRGAGSDESAVVYVEFLFVFPIVFFVFLCATQFAFLTADKVLVQHAASNAARSAAVIAPEAAGMLGGIQDTVSYISDTGGGSASADDDGNSFSKLLRRFIGNAAQGVANFFSMEGDLRMKKIRSVAYKPLLPMSPPPDAIFYSGTSYLNIEQHAIGKAEKRLMTGLAYVTSAVSVTFPRTAGEESINTAASDEVSFSGLKAAAPNRNGEMLTARVTYASMCNVPVARNVLCSRWPDLDEHQPHAFAEMQKAGSRKLWGMFVLTFNRFMLLRADGVFPYQGAAYEYRRGDQLNDENGGDSE